MRDERTGRRRLTEAIESALATVATSAFRRPFLALLGLVLLTAAAVPALGSLRVDADLTRLLPSSFESVRDVDRLRERFGGVGYVAVLVEGADESSLRAIADALASRLEGLEGVRWVEAREPVEFFETHALHYLDPADLEEVADRLEERRQWEVSRRNPFYVSLDADEGPPSIDFSELIEEYGARFGIDLEGDGGGYHLDPTSGRLVLLVKPERLASDLHFARALVDRVQAAVESFDSSAHGEGVSIQLSGRYKKKVDLQDVIEGDLKLASLLALLLVLGYVAVHFRKARAVPLVLVPLVVGLVWTYALAATLVGTLNIITGFIGAILLGLGIDNGIHLLSRYESERAHGQAPEEAVRAAFGETGRAALLATTTTTVAFAVVATSEFRAFREFGGVAALGMGSVFFAYLVGMPALLGALVRWFGPKAPSRSSTRLFGVEWIGRWAPAVFWVLLFGLFGAALAAPSVRFDDDFASLDPQELPSYQLDREVNRILGRSQTPLVIETSGPDEARRVVETLRTAKERRGETSGIDRVLSTVDLVPPDQETKREAMAQIGEAAKWLEERTEDPAQAETLARLRRMAEEPAFGEADLPEAVRRRFEPVRGTESTELVLVLPGVSLSDGDAVRALAHELRAIPAGDQGQTVRAAGEAMVLADVLEQVMGETPRIVAWTLVAVALCLLLLLGRPMHALLALAPAVATLVIVFGAMPLLGIELNYLNVIVLPVLLGVGVDGGAHLMARMAGDVGWERAVGETGRAIVGASLTTGMGFGALLIAHHPGLASLAHLALLGLGANVIASVFFLPSLLALLRWKERRRGIVSVLVSVGGAGWAPRAGGSLGALPAIGIAWALRDAGWLPWVAILGVGTMLSVWLAHRYCADGDGTVRDPQEIVLDELVGCLFALAFVPFEPLWVAAAYGLFRLLDIAKPWPIRAFERRVHGGVGVIADDVLAGVLAGGALALVHLLLGNVG